MLQGQAQEGEEAADEGFQPTAGQAPLVYSAWWTGLALLLLLDEAHVALLDHAVQQQLLRLALHQAMSGGSVHFEVAGG